MMLGIKEYAILTLCGIITLLTLYTKYTISKLEDQLKAKDTIILETRLQSSLYKTGLDAQTASINALATNYEKSIEELEEWKNKSVEVRYEKVYKYIPKVEYVKGDCNDTKELIQSIANIDYSDL